MVRHKRELVIAVALFLIATLVFIFGWTNLFNAKAVSVSGAPNEVVASQILKVAGVEVGDKLARIETRNISSKLALAGFDWVESVDISRNWFARKVEIKIKPRVAVAQVANQYLDINGVLFTAPVQLDTNIISNLATISAADQSSRKSAIDFYLGLPSEFRKSVKRVIATSSTNFQFFRDDGLRVIWGSAANTALKIKIFSALKALPENSKITMMDVSDPTKPIVK